MNEVFSSALNSHSKKIIENDPGIQRLLLTHFDQECLGVVLKDADSRVVSTILDAGKCSLPGGHTRAEEHGIDGSSCRDTGIIYDFHSLSIGCGLAAITRQDLTLGIVEHPEGIGVMVTKKLPHYDRMMLLNQVQVDCVEFLSKPWLISLLLEEPRRNVANDEHLVEG